MKTIMKKQNIVAVIFAGAILFQFTSVAFAQFYDTGTTYSTYDTGFSSYDIGTSYSTFNTGTTYPTYDTGTTYPTYSTGVTYPTYSTGDTYSTYNTGTTYPTYDTGTTYPTYNTGTTYPTYDTGTTFPTYDTGVSYPTYDTGTTYPTYDTGVSYPSYTTTGVTPVTYGVSTYSSPTYQIGISYGDYNYGGYNYAPTVGSYGYTYGGYTNNPTCPSGSTLINGTCQINTTTCPSGTTLIGGSCVVNATSTCAVGSTFINGVCQINTTVCPSGSTLINGTCQITNTSCPAGSVLVNGTCQINTSSCPSGSTLINGVCTIITVNTNYTCWNGTIVSYSSLCPINYNYPSYTYPSTNYIGSSYYTNTQPIVKYPTVTPLPTVKFNNVVTSVVTQITNNSGRCNGIGLIPNGAQSTGWFEYGETSNLGRTTATASIGNSSTAPFSNVLANLKPSTRYYCRAVMQNQYGIVKGEIVSFVTKSTAVAYVKPVTTTKKTVANKVATTSVKKPTLVTCSDGSSFYAKNESQATVLNQGEKLVTLQIEKSEGKLTANSQVSYKIVYKNATDSRLTGVVVKVLIPREIKFELASSGVYDEATNILTINQDTLDAHAEGIVAISGKVEQDATIGKSIVTTAYVIYTVPGTSVQDEVTAYVVGSITPNDSVSNKDTGAKKVIGAGSERGFMPNNLVEWLALIAIIFIIFILARSIYASYQEDKESSK